MTTYSLFAQRDLPNKLSCSNSSSLVLLIIALVMSIESTFFFLRFPSCDLSCFVGIITSKPNKLKLNPAASSFAIASKRAKHYNRNNNSNNNNSLKSTGSNNKTSRNNNDSRRKNSNKAILDNLFKLNQNRGKNLRKIRETLIF